MSQRQMDDAMSICSCDSEPCEGLVLPYVEDPRDPDPSFLGPIGSTLWFQDDPDPASIETYSEIMEYRTRGDRFYEAATWHSLLVRKLDVRASASPPNRSLQGKARRR